MLTLEALPEPNFGCGPTDWGCLAMEASSRFFVAGIQSMGNFMADMLTNAFAGSRPDNSSWSVADSGFWFWVSVLGIVVAIVAIAQLMPAMLLKDGRRALTIGLGAAAAVPSSVLGVWLMRQASAYGDTVTDHIMHAVQGQSIAQALMHVFGWADVNGQATLLSDSAFMSGQLAPGNTWTAVGQYLLMFLITAIMALAALFLYIGMAIRSFTLLLLAATAPLGLMMIGQPKLSAWAHRWASLALGTILAQPLAAFVIFLSVALLGHSDAIGPLFVAAGAVFVAAFAPMWAVGLVSFAGRETASALAARPRIRDNASRAGFTMKVVTFGRLGR